MTDTLTPVPERVARLDEIELRSGGHEPPSATCTHPEGCAEEIAAWVMGLPWSDQPETVSPVISSLMIRLNDSLPDDLRQELKPFLITQHGTADDGHDTARGWMAADWSIRVATPTWLELAGVTEAAEKLRALLEITPETINEHRPYLRELREEMREQREATREDLKQRIQAEMEKKGITGAATDADAAATYADNAAAVAGSDSAATDADAAAAAGTDSIAAAAAAAVAAKIEPYSERHGEIRDADYSAVCKRVREEAEKRYRPAQQSLMDGIKDLLTRMIEVGR